MPVFEPFENAFTTLAQDLACGLGQDTGMPIEQRLDPGKALVSGWAEPTVSSDSTKAFGQDVLEEAANEFVAFEAQELGLSSSALGVLEDDVLAVVSHDGVFAHGGATDVARKVVYNVFARANRLAVGVPMLPPNAGRDGLVKGGVGFLHGLLHEGTHLDREAFDREKVIGISGAHPGAVRRETALGNDVMKVRVVFELTCPGVEYA